MGGDGSCCYRLAQAYGVPYGGIAIINNDSLPVVVLSLVPDVVAIDVEVAVGVFGDDFARCV